MKLIIPQWKNWNKLFEKLKWNIENEMSFLLWERNLRNGFTDNVDCYVTEGAD